MHVCLHVNDAPTHDKQVPSPMASLEYNNFWLKPATIWNKHTNLKAFK